MADDADGYVPNVTLPDNDPGAGYVPAGAPPVDAPPPAATAAPGFLSQAWHSVQGIPASLWSSTPAPAATPTGPIGDTEAPFFNAIPHGIKQTFDKAAEKLALGGEYLLGKDTAAALPGYRSAEDIRGDITQRQKDYEANPLNDASSTGAAIGQGVGEGLVLGGPLMRIGGGVAAALRLTGATALPWVARGLEYLGGGAEAAADASKLASLATRFASLAGQGSTIGAGVAGVTADPAKPILPQIAEGAGEGAIAGPLVGSTLAAAAYPARAALGLLPNMVKPEIAPLAERFIKQYGIDLDPTQLASNPTYRIMADQAGKLPFSGAGDRIAQARLQWQQATSGEMGEAAPNGITHDVMDSAATRIGKVYDDVGARTTLQADNPYFNDIATIGQDIPRFGLSESQLTKVQAQLQNVQQAFRQGNGRMTGEAYQNLIQTGGPLDDALTSTDPTVAAFAQRIKSALDGVFERSATPADRAALQQANYQYRVMKTLQPLVEQKGLTGDINPNGLLQRVREQSKRFDSSKGGIAYTGGGKLGDLAYGGQLFFGPAPESGTAARNLIMGGLLGGGASNVVQHPVQTAVAGAGTLAGLLANRAAQSMLRSPAVGASMVERTLNPSGPIAQRAAPYVLPGLLGDQVR